MVQAAVQGVIDQANGVAPEHHTSRPRIGFNANEFIATLSDSQKEAPLTSLRHQLASPDEQSTQIVTLIDQIREIAQNQIIRITEMQDRRGRQPTLILGGHIHNPIYNDLLIMPTEVDDVDFLTRFYPLKTAKIKKKHSNRLDTINLRIDAYQINRSGQVQSCMIGGVWKPVGIKYKVNNHSYLKMCSM